MQRYILVRFAQALSTLILVATAVFFLQRATGDPADALLPTDAPEEARIDLRRSLGLDKPLVVQFVYFLRNSVTGDFGDSFRTGRPVTEEIRSRLPNSLKLAGFAMVLTLLVGLPLGILAATHKGTPVETLAKALALLGQAAPSFWLAIILIEVFAVRVQLLPVAGTGDITHYILPGVTLSTAALAGVVRLLRSSMLDVLDSDFIRFARIKGLPERTVISKHALRNALIPVVTFAGLYLPVFISSAVVVEAVFAWPGVGRLVFQSILSRDFPVTHAVVLMGVALTLAINFVVDVSYGYLEPRARP